MNGNNYCPWFEKTNSVFTLQDIWDLPRGKCWTPDSGHVPNELCILSWIYCDHFGVLDGVLVDCRYFRRMDSNQQLSDPNWPGDFRHQQRSDRRRRLVDRLTVWVWMPAQLPQKRKRKRALEEAVEEAGKPPAVEMGWKLRMISEVVIYIYVCVLISCYII